jgi:hypothetical protein
MMTIAYMMRMRNKESLSCIIMHNNNIVEKSPMVMTTAKTYHLQHEQQRPNGIPEGYDDFMSDLQLTVEITSSQTAVVFKVGGFHQVSDEFVQSIPHV